MEGKLGYSPVTNSYFCGTMVFDIGQVTHVHTNMDYTSLGKIGDQKEECTIYLRQP